jgi:hypothetical protein
MRWLRRRVDDEAVVLTLLLLLLLLLRCVVVCDLRMPIEYANAVSFFLAILNALRL